MSALNIQDIDYPALQDRAMGAYLGLAIGDAFGATVEFMTAREIIRRYGEHKDIKGGGWLHLKPGQVTDDTTMSLALGESILSSRHINAFDIAQAFSDWMKNKPVDIGNTVRRGIISFRYSDMPVMPESDSDAGNGACMRCLPIALATFGKDRSYVITSSRTQAHVTHNNKLSDAGTECIVLCLQALFSGASKEDILHGPVAELIEQHPEFRFCTKRVTDPSGYIVDTLKAVFQAFFSNESFEACLIDVVNRGGDADTSGAIIGMLAGAYYGTAQIPARWLYKMDRHVVEKCKSQAMALIEKSPVITINAEFKRQQASS